MAGVVQIFVEKNWCCNICDSNVNETPDYGLEFQLNFIFVLNTINKRGSIDNNNTMNKTVIKYVTHIQQVFKATQLKFKQDQ